MTDGSLPRRARTPVALVVAAGVLCLAAAAPDLRSWGLRQALACLALTAAVAVAEFVPLSVRQGSSVLLVTLSEALWTAGLLLFVAGPAPHPAVLILAVAAGAVAGQAAGGRPMVKTAFNAGQYVVSVTVAVGVFRLLAGDAPPVDPGTWAAAAAAMAACYVVNTGLTALVISTVEGRAWLPTIRPTMAPSLLHWAGNVAVGILGAVVWLEVPAAAPLLLVPALVSYAASRRWLQGRLERDRMRTLYEAGRSLAGPLDGAGFGPFLGLVEQLLDARSAELVVVDGDAVTIHDRRGSASLQTGTPAANGHRPHAYVPVRDGISPQVAVVGAPGDGRGVLAVYRPRELSVTERSLLDDLAAQVGVRLANQRLLGAAREERAEVSDVIAHSSDGIFVVSAAGVIESWNPAMEHMTGRASARAVGRTWADVFGPDGHGEGPAPSPGAAARDPEQGGDILLVRTDGAERWLRYTRSPLGDQHGAARGEVVVARDITADLESERLQADFVATVSHELRTPLTPLKGFLATLIAGTGEDDPEARQEYYRIMQHQTERLERLITDLLEVARIEGGRVPMDDRTVDVTGLVQGQIDDFARQQPDREIRLQAPGAPVLASCDPFRVGQIVSNLLSNALKYSAPGSPVELTVAQAGHEQAIVSVRDEGEGIPLEEQERVFERFHRVEGHLTRRTGGTGLGLYIARRLVEAMRGRIWVVSSPGNGSTFSFSLPSAPPDEDGPGTETVGVDRVSGAGLPIR